MGRRGGQVIIHIIDAADGTRHIHAAGCGHIQFQIEAGEVDELELPDDVDEDEVLLAIWEDVLDPDLADDDVLDEHDDRTVYRRCASELLGFEEEASGVATESSGNAKADDFMDEAEEAGWVVEFTEEDELVKVQAKREYIGQAFRTHQVLDLTWSSTRLEDAHYLSGIPGEVAKRLSSVKGAITILNGPYPKEEARTDGRKVNREEPVKRVLKEIIPIDLNEAYDDEIIAAVQGKTIVWWNNTAEDYESHFCMRQKNHIKIESGNAGRAILTFISPIGFRSVAIEEIVQIK